MMGVLELNKVSLGEKLPSISLIAGAFWQM
jgi:hypothetical protein